MGDPDTELCGLGSGCLEQEGGKGHEVQGY